MKCSALLIVLLLVGGCAAKIEAPLSPPTKVKMPADVRELCDDVPAAPGRGTSMGELYTYTDGLIGQYAECALRDRAKRRWVESQGM